MGAGNYSFAQTSSVVVTSITANYSASPPTVTFKVSWPAGSRNANERSKVWLLVDYRRIQNNAYTGGWLRAGIDAAHTPTTNSGTVSLESGNTKGFWLQGPNDAFAFAATVTVPVTVNLNGYAPQFGWCGVASDRPPVAILQAGGYYALQGTPDFIIQTHPTDKSSTVTESTTTYNGCIYGLTDATGCPGEWSPGPAISAFTATATDICAGQSVTLTANATNAESYSFDNGANWQPAATKTVTPSTTTTYTLKVTRTNGACTATYPTQLTITVHPVPELEFVSPPAAVCANSTATFTVNDKNGAASSYCFTYECTDCTHNGGYLSGNDEAATVGCDWFSECVYDEANTYTVYGYDAGTLTVWAKAITAAGCTASLDQAATVTVKDPPAAPSVSSLQTFCSGSNPAIAILSATGTDIKWYNVASGGTALVSATDLTSGTYYASQTIDGCESPRVAVTVTVHTAPDAPTGASSNTLCGTGAVTFSASVPDSVTIDWYDASTNGNIVSGGTGTASLSPNLSATTTYYAQSRNTTTGCVSASRLAVTGTIHTAVGGASISGAASNTCPAATVTLTATASGATTFTWYKDNVEVLTGTSDTYTASASGSYTVQGKNANCTGSTSSQKIVTIKCGDVPGCDKYNIRLYQTTASRDGSGKWTVANDYCTDPTRNARVPSIEELACMCEHKDAIPGSTEDGFYWSSTPHGSSGNYRETVRFDEDCDQANWVETGSRRFRCVL